MVGVDFKSTDTIKASGETEEMAKVAGIAVWDLFKAQKTGKALDRPFRTTCPREAWEAVQEIHRRVTGDDT